ncbi:Polypeptide N-acetylgalactosaminyltransferase [Fasciola gigantica]|uniref:Polypeptide N-acetylgalactosaminyltransferase n=1 Tax=Fasciola gigantica TaxID=46835 RepID=A0A504YK89_FASGI|nr:Polypeptide N-acetylgalactosaminyltransferase [Fasciola gigantica]
MTEEERKMEHYHYIPNGFNKLTSDKIALDRSLPDIRHEKCKSMKYLRNLPTVSVIIPFFEEHWSVLLRTFISIVMRSPKQLLKEVILVDDGSTGRPELKGQLDDYLESNYPSGLVRVIRSATHEGLIRARLIGARQAIGDVLVFLDSHCEVTRNWLPPLLDPIVRDYHTVTCPIIDAIDAGSFGYSARSGGPRGAFTWEMYYVRLPKLPKDEPFPEKPFDDLIMAGGLLAVSRKWFWEMGAYDPELEVWGGEQFEISFKVWMCGGRLLDVPCSRVGHVFRTKGPFFNGTVPKGNYVARNYKRVIEVWLDEYKQYVYSRRPHYLEIDAGDLTEQYAIRKRLNCKSFKWFVENCAPDVAQKYPLIEPPPAAFGDIRPVNNMTLCVDAADGSLIRLNECVRDSVNRSGLQNFIFTFHDEIHPVSRTDCMDSFRPESRAIISLYPCFGGRGNQEFTLIPVLNRPHRTVMIKHVPTTNCLESEIKTKSVFVNPCEMRNTGQQWIWESIDISRFHKTVKSPTS